MALYDINVVAEIVSSNFQRVARKYGMKLVIVDEIHLELRSSGVRVRFSFGRYTYAEWGLMIYVGEVGPIDVRNLHLLRSNLRVAGIDKPNGHTGEENFPRELRKLEDILLRHADDVLAGNTDKLTEERYFDFAKFMSKVYIYSTNTRQDKALIVPSLGSGDWTWLKSPWMRYQKGEPAFPDMPEIR